MENTTKALIQYTVCFRGARWNVLAASRQEACQKVADHTGHDLSLLIAKKVRQNWQQLELPL